MSENETIEPAAEAVETAETATTEEVKAEVTDTKEVAAETAEAPAEEVKVDASDSKEVVETPEAPAEEAKAEVEAAPEVPAEPEEISYHAVEKDDEITAIWEMQGRKHIRTISARSGEGQKILSLFTSEIHETDSPAMGNKVTTEEAAA